MNLSLYDKNSTHLNLRGPFEVQRDQSNRLNLNKCCKKIPQQFPENNPFITDTRDISQQEKL